MRAYTAGWLAAGWLLAAGEAFAQLPGTGLPGGSAPATQAKPAGPELPPPYVTRQSEVDIPFSVKAGSTPETQPAAVRVFVSWDRGQAWHFFEEKQPDAGSFRFKPRQDGEFWFATQTVDRTGRTDAAQPSRPQLRLVIDTQKPQLLAQASVARPGEVTLAWSAADGSLSPASLKIEYQDAAGNGGPWQSVLIDPAATSAAAGQATGRATFEPQVSSKTINLRAEVADAAGNVAYYSQRLSLVPPRTARAGIAAPAPPPDRTATRWPTKNEPSNNPFIEAGDGQSLLADSRSGNPAPQETVTIPDVVQNPFSRQDRLVSSPAPPATAEQLPTPAPVETLPSPVPPESLTPSSLPQPHSQPEVVPSEARQTEALPSDTPATESVAAPQGNRPRLTSLRRFSLDYDVETVGPEGLADVELWGTSDGGRTWAKWGSDPDQRSPFDVEVTGEALYGFRVVIVGKSGLASNAPQAGDAADIWVGIDLTRPKARLVSAAYGQGEAAGKLDIRWEAGDANLGSRPVMLAIGERPDGPFTPIAAGLPNSGQYFWEFDPRSPRLLYLRLEVRDDAGNIAIDQLTEPIKVDGLQPKGKIRGFAPAEAPRGAARPAGYR